MTPREASFLYGGALPSTLGSSGGLKKIMGARRGIWGRKKAVPRTVSRFIQRVCSDPAVVAVLHIAEQIAGGAFAVVLCASVTVPVALGVQSSMPGAVSRQPQVVLLEGAEVLPVKPAPKAVHVAGPVRGHFTYFSEFSRLANFVFEGVTIH